MQSVAEVGRAIADHGQRYLDRLFTPAEQERVVAGPGGAPGGAAAAYAGLYAAKEAVLKLLGDPGGIDLREIEVTVPAEGPITVTAHGTAADRARECRLGLVSLSVAHEGPLVIAVAVAEGAVASSPGYGLGDPADDHHRPDSGEGTDD